MAKISFKSFAREDVTVSNVTVAGVDAVFKRMEALVTPSGVVTFEEDNEEDGLDEDRSEAVANVLVGAMGVTKEGMVIYSIRALMVDLLMRCCGWSRRQRPYDRMWMCGRGQYQVGGRR